MRLYGTCLQLAYPHTQLKQLREVNLSYIRRYADYCKMNNSYIPSLMLRMKQIKLHADLR